MDKHRVPKSKLENDIETDSFIRSMYFFPSENKLVRRIHIVVAVLIAAIMIVCLVLHTCSDSVDEDASSIELEEIKDEDDYTR